MAEHPVIGGRIVDASDTSSDIRDVMVHHRDYFDRSGYPDRQARDEISETTRLITMSDVFCALIERRLYKPDVRPGQAYAIQASMNQRLDLPLVRAFRQVI